MGFLSRLLGARETGASTSLLQTGPPAPVVATISGKPSDLYLFARGFRPDKADLQLATEGLLARETHLSADDLNGIVVDVQVLDESRDKSFDMSAFIQKWHPGSGFREASVRSQRTGQEMAMVAVWTQKVAPRPAPPPPPFVLEPIRSEPAAGSFAVCDICSVAGDGTAVGAPDIRCAVLKHGFNPIAAGLVKSYAGTAEHAYQTWKAFVERDASDWHVCNHCFPSLKSYLSGAPKPTGVNACEVKVPLPSSSRPYNEQEDAKYQKELLRQHGMEHDTQSAEFLAEFAKRWRNR